MKTKTIGSFVMLSFWVILLSCSETDQPIELKPVPNGNDNITGNDTTPPGPALTLGYSEFLGCILQTKNSGSVDSYDTLAYEMINDSLVIHAAIRWTCGACMTDSLVINDPVVDIYVQDTCGLVTYCICYHKFDYSFSAYGEEHTFNLYFKPYDEEGYTLWASLNYP